MKRWLIVLLCGLNLTSILHADPIAQTERLLVDAGSALAHVAARDLKGVADDLSSYAQGWLVAKSSFATETPAIEAALGASQRALAQAAANPAALETLRGALAALTRETNELAESKSLSDKGRTQDLTALTSAADSLLAALKGDDLLAAQVRFHDFESQWGVDEGAVRSVDQGAYTTVELASAQLRSALGAQPFVKDAALGPASQIAASLGGLRIGGGLSAFDAGFLLLREGLEAILVLAALLAFVRKTDAKQLVPWVWGGAGTGLGASALVAILFSLWLNRIMGDSALLRESIEGFSGAAAVLLMISVGVWLHRRSGLQAWNASIKSKMGKAIASGSYWSLAGVAFLAVFREGAETIVFLMGMVAAIPTGQLVLGLGGAAIILVVIAWLIIGLSIRLPLRPFFLAATILIDFLCIKVAGQSITALQAANVLPQHPINQGPRWDWIGLSPSWECLVTQLVLLVGLGSLVLVTERNHSKAAPAKK